jgi:polysaccharide export outer membrane protein
MPRETGTKESYRLGTGDKVKITVFGQTDLSGEFIVDDQGVLQLPLIGQVKAAGLTIDDFQKSVTAKLADGYLRDPRVSVEVANYRPFYIIGEVSKPGEYPYVNGMNALNAVALAGGYTYRADDSVVYVRRKGNPVEEKDPADQTTIIYPGDIIRVAERFF